MHDIRPRPVLWTALAIALVVAVVVAAVLAWLQLRGTAPGGERLRFPYDARLDAPGLASAPQDELKRDRQRKQAWLDSAGWVDERAGIAHIPIGDAMDMLVARQARPAVPQPQTPPALPPPPRARLEQRIGAQLPLDVPVVDEDGHTRTLSTLVDGRRPVLLVPGYYRCPELCGLVMHDLLDALQASGAPRERWRIVGIGIDPQEGPQDARVRRAAYEDYAAFRFAADPHGMPELHLLTLAAPSIQRLTGALGIELARIAQSDPAAATIAHPATVVLLTPHGVVAQYFNGISIDPPALRVALADAAGDRLGSVSGRLALLCAHFDPKVGRLDRPVMNAARIGGALLVLGLGGWCWRRRNGAAMGRP